MEPFAILRKTTAHGVLRCFFVMLAMAIVVAPAPVAALSYTAELTGIEDPELQEAMERASSTISSSNKTVPSFNALKLRTANDVERLKNVAKYYGYFDCRIETRLTPDPTPAVTFDIQLGPLFSFGQLTIDWNDRDMVIDDLTQRKDSALASLKGPTLKDVPSFRAGEPATGKAIVAFDTELVRALRSRSFAFARVVSKEVVVDKSSHIVDISIVVQTGPIVRFGTTKIIGAEKVQPEFFSINQGWTEGQLYSPILLEKTENTLQRSGLFQSVQVEEGNDLENNWALPIIINVTEAKPRTVGAGISYTTTYGAGISAQWEHRNMQGLGRKLSLNVELWQKMRMASVSYTFPHFQRDDQSLIWILEYDHQNYLPFTSSAITGSGLINRQLTKRTNIVYGLSLERLESTGIIHHKLWYLAKAPLQLKWSNANAPLDPTKGLAVNLRLTPAYQFNSPHYTYLIETASLAVYQSLWQDAITFAVRAGIGNIIGASNHDIPLPDRFFGGSQNSLRGYKTGYVSPLNQRREPIGGLSMLTGSFEIRTRTQKGLGWVAFYDCGNVYRHVVPDPHRHTVLQSVGLGIRYATPIGPLRLDIAFPLNRRRHIDPFVQLYFSIGQAF